MITDLLSRLYQWISSDTSLFRQLTAIKYTTKNDDLKRKTNIFVLIDKNDIEFPSCGDYPGSAIDDISSGYVYSCFGR